jgi:hypothetical protein
MNGKNQFEDIVMAELEKLLRQELAAGLSTVFAGLRAAQTPSAASPLAADSALNIIIHNNAGGSVSAREGAGPLGQKQLEITIDQMVARALSGGRETTGVMRALFGLAPHLIGR